MELLNLLTQHLEISEEQAKGGAGILLKMAQESLGAEKFSQISRGVPGLDQLIASAPQTGGLGGMLGGISSALGGKVGQFSHLADLAGGFQKLGLNQELIGKFLPIILSFVQDKGGETVKNLLENALHRTTK